jgi:hypothetical protein
MKGSMKGSTRRRDSAAALSAPPMPDIAQVVVPTSAPVAFALCLITA